MKKTIIALTAMMLSGISSGITLAYLSGSDAVVNEITAADTAITVEEEFDPPDELVPGTVIKKVPQVRSLSRTPCYVRMRALFSDSVAEDFCEALQIQDGWTLKDDGYYYWNQVLEPGEVTGPLFKQIVICDDADPDVLQGFELMIYAEAVEYSGDAQKSWESVTE